MTPHCCHRAAITGVGLVSGFGVGAGETWSALRRGKSAIRCLELEGSRVLGAPVSMPGDDLSSEPNVAMALTAAREAVDDADLSPHELAGSRSAVTVSSSKGGMKSLFRLHREFLEHQSLEADFWELVSPSAPGSVVARLFGITGPVINYAAACATGVHSVIAGMQMIAAGDADVVLAGATDASLVQPLVAAFDRMGVLSQRMDDPEGACRPYDRTRDGFAIGEGAAVLVLESEERARPERTYAHVCGTAWGADAYDLARVDTAHSLIGPLVTEAILRAGTEPRLVDYVNTHGTGTWANDPIEAAAVREALGDAADRAYASSLKPSIGHLLGAAGGAELALTVLAMHHGFAPPTLNLNDPDPRCELNHVPRGGIERELRVAVKIAAGFGGHIGVVVLERGDRKP